MLYTCFRCNWKLVRMSVVCHLLPTLLTTYILIRRRQTPGSCIVIRTILAGNTSLKLRQYRDVPICTQPWFAVEVGTYRSCFSCSSPSLPRSYQNDQLFASVSSISRSSLRRTGNGQGHITIRWKRGWKRLRDFSSLQRFSFIFSGCQVFPCCPWSP